MLVLSPHSIYQEYLARVLTDKYGNLNMEMDRIINEANAQIDKLTQKLSRSSHLYPKRSIDTANRTPEMEVEQEKLKTDKANLAAALREKARKHQQTHELYERLKRKEMAAATKIAAFDSVDDVLQYAGGPDAPDIARDAGHAYHGVRRAGSDGSAGLNRTISAPRAAPSFGRTRALDGSWWCGLR